MKTLFLSFGPLCQTSITSPLSSPLLNFTHYHPFHPFRTPSPISFLLLTSSKPFWTPFPNLRHSSRLYPDSSELTPPSSILLSSFFTLLQSSVHPIPVHLGLINLSSYSSSKILNLPVLLFFPCLPLSPPTSPFSCLHLIPSSPHLYYPDSFLVFTSWTDYPSHLCLTPPILTSHLSYIQIIISACIYYSLSYLTLSPTLLYPLVDRLPFPACVLLHQSSHPNFPVFRLPSPRASFSPIIFFQCYLVLRVFFPRGLAQKLDPVAEMCS